MVVSPAVGHIFLNDFVECVYNDVKHLCCIQKFLSGITLCACMCIWNEEASNSISIFRNNMMVCLQKHYYWSTIQLSPVLTS